MKESYGDLEKLKELGKNKENSFTTEQLLDIELKNEGGESGVEVRKRMEKAFNKVLAENIGKKIAIVSHGVAIKFLLTKWCKLNENINIEFDNKEIIVNSPGVIKLVFEGQKLIELKQIV